MSDIKKARALLERALRSSQIPTHVRSTIKQALGLMRRRRPKFIARRTRHPALTPTDKIRVDEMRGQEIAMSDIAKKLDTNIGRVSTHINKEKENEN